jgi:hypothetical protein
VCRDCNSGWVSRLDSAAKNFAPALIRGEQTQLDRGGQQALAAWLAKIAMVVDTNRLDNSAIPQFDREWIMEQAIPPLLWEIWISSYHGTAWRDLALFHHGGELNISPIGRPRSEPFYLTTTAIGMGCLFAVVIGNGNPGINLTTTAFFHLERIWPARNSFRWPFAQSLTDDQASEIASTLEAAVKAKRILQT